MLRVCPGLASYIHGILHPTWHPVTFTTIQRGGAGVPILWISKERPREVKELTQATLSQKWLQALCFRDY